jgi:hypothetical protein
MQKSNAKAVGSRVARVRLRWFAAVAMAAAGAVAHAEVARQGTEYVLSRMSGDQIKPSVAIGTQGGVMAWEDNATDGDGQGVSAQLLTASGSVRGERFRINEIAAGDQQNVQSVMMADGATLFVWQGGKPGFQKVSYRVLAPNGTFRTKEIQLSPAGSTDNRNPVAAALPDGGAVLAWTSQGLDGHMAGVAVQRIDRNGVAAGSLIQANDYTAGNQRSPAIAATQGGFAVAWVSEWQTGPERSDIYLRRYLNDGTPVGSISRANVGVEPASMPAVAGVGSEIWVAWSRIQDPATPIAQLSVTERSRWATYVRRFDSQGNPITSESPLSDQSKGDQTNVQFAVSSRDVMAIWSSTQMDGSGGARLFTLNGLPQGSAFVVNSITADEQLHPVAAASSDGTFVAAWTDWRGLDDGMELAVQRFAPVAQPLAALPAPVVSGLSSWQVKATWAPVQGIDVARYEVAFDDGQVFQTTQPFWESPDVLPSTLHKVQVAYVLPDGRRSAWSVSAEGKSWGKDANNDGLPDDWQATYFGTQAMAWPKPNVDSDGDGVSDQNEFLGGTNPKDPNDNLAVAIRSTEQGTSLTWKTKVGGIYQVQSSRDLRAWTDMGGYRFAPSDNDSLVAPGVSANSYFRVNRIR